MTLIVHVYACKQDVSNSSFISFSFCMAKACLWRSRMPKCIRFQPNGRWQKQWYTTEYGQADDWSETEVVVSAWRDPWCCVVVLIVVVLSEVLWVGFSWVLRVYYCDQRVRQCVADGNENLLFVKEVKSIHPGYKDESIYNNDRTATLVDYKKFLPLYSVKNTTYSSSGQGRLDQW